jgi:hypothetical protein
LGVTVPARLAETLTTPPARQRLVERALETPLDLLASFLG